MLKNRKGKTDKMRKYLSRIILFFKANCKFVLTIESVYAIQWRHKRNIKCYHIPTDKNYVFKDYSEAKKAARNMDLYWVVLEHFVASRKIYSSPLLGMVKAKVCSGLKSVNNLKWLFSVLRYERKAS